MSDPNVTPKKKKKLPKKTRSSVHLSASIEEGSRKKKKEKKGEKGDKSSARGEKEKGEKPKKCNSGGTISSKAAMEGTVDEERGKGMAERLPPAGGEGGGGGGMRHPSPAFADRSRSATVTVMVGGGGGLRMRSPTIGSSSEKEGERKQNNNFPSPTFSSSGGPSPTPSSNPSSSVSSSSPPSMTKKPSNSSPTSSFSPPPPSLTHHPLPATTHHHPFISSQSAFSLLTPASPFNSTPPSSPPLPPSPPFIPSSLANSPPLPPSSAPIPPSIASPSSPSSPSSSSPPTSPVGWKRKGRTESVCEAPNALKFGVRGRSGLQIRRPPGPPRNVSDVNSATATANNNKPLHNSDPFYTGNTNSTGSASPPPPGPSFRITGRSNTLRPVTNAPGSSPSLINHSPTKFRALSPPPSSSSPSVSSLSSSACAPFSTSISSLPPSPPFPSHSPPLRGKPDAPPGLEDDSLSPPFGSSISSSLSLPSLTDSPERKKGPQLRATLKVAGHPFLDVLRISGQKKTLSLDECDIVIEKMSSQMQIIISRPLTKGSAVSDLVKKECQTFSLVVEEDGKMLFIDNNEALAEYVRKSTIIYFAEKPILTPSEIQNDARSRIVNEIIETERTYISGLLEMYQYRIGLTRGAKKLEEAAPVDRQKRKTRKMKSDEPSFSDVEAVFDHLEELIELNGNFYLTLKERLREWSDSQLIGDCFISLVKSDPVQGGDEQSERCDSERERKSKLTGAQYVYAEWGKNYNFALSVFEKMKHNSAMNEKLKNLKRTLDLDAILIMPVQRLPRYSLLINDLLKRTEKDHPDYGSLIQAGVEIENLTVHVDEQIKRMQNSNNEIGKDYPWLQKYLTSERTLQLHLKTTARRRVIGKYQCQPKFPSTDERVVLFLFDDMLILWFEDENPVEIPINLVWLKETEKEDQFELLLPLFSLVISCEGPRVKLQWEPFVKRAILNYLSENEPKGGEEKKKKKKEGEHPPETRKGNFQFSGGALYTGEWVYGVMSGTGFLAVNGSVYTGGWASAQRHGKGKLVLFDGTEYESFWVDDINTGYGKISSCHGVYCGSLVAGLRHGEGRAEYKNGDVYDGLWANDIPHGKGTLKTSMATFDGEFNNGIYHGTGTLTTNQYEYVGQFYQGIKEGEGKLKDKDFTYEGGFLGNYFHGLGKWEHVDGAVYLGDFENGLRHGEGSLSLPDSTKYIGSWKRGRQSGKGTLTFSDGCCYNGNFKGGRMHGVGSLKIGDYVLEGQWKNGLRDGFFIIRETKSIPEEKEKEVINKIRSSTKTRTTTDTETMTFKDGVLVNCSNPSLLQNVIFPPWRCHNFSYI